MPRPVFPELVLPRSGRYRKKHPFVVHMEDWLAAEPGRTKTGLARIFGITQASLQDWIYGCEAGPYRIQAERVPTAAVLFDIEPALLRPDLYPKGFKFEPAFAKLPKETKK